jgi:hypothetical protein
MSEIDYIGASELVFNNDKEAGVHSGGFSVNSIMMKAGMSPIMTINNPERLSGGGDKVSDLFNDLVVPNWALSYNNRIVGGGKYKEVERDDSDSEDSVIDDDLHDKLLELVKEHNSKAISNANSKEVTNSKKKITRRIKKNESKKGGTKRRK